MLKSYISLTKPGIIFGNLITAAAGFFLASRGSIDFPLFFAVTAGITCIIASACVVNNDIDRAIDDKMERTKNRALVKKVISVTNARIYATVLGVAGFLILFLTTNLLTVSLGFIAFFIYVVLYGIAKRRSIHGTIIGSVAGAMPPVAGYCAVSNRLDVGAMLLFFILVFWQMPHFYAIAIYRGADYAAASIPVLPIKKGIFITKIHILFYIAVFIVAALMLTLLGFTGYTYLFFAAICSFYWFTLSLKGFWIKNNSQWARSMFFSSLVVIIVLSILMSIDNAPKA